MRKLRVFRSVGEVFSGVTRHYFQLLFVAWPAVVLIAVGMALYFWVLYRAGLASYGAMDSAASPDEVLARYGNALEGIPVWAVVTAVAVMMMASAVAAVRWHRFVLLGDASSVFLRREDFRYVWTTVNLFFFVVLFAIAIGLVVGVAAALFALLMGGFDAIASSGLTVGILALLSIPLLFVGYALMLAFVIRLMLALPGAAVGAGKGVIETLRATGGNMWRIAGYTLLIYVPFTIGVVLIQYIVAAALDAADGAGGVLGAVFAAIVALAVYLYFVMTQITMLSVAYREIVGLPDDATLATGPEPTPAA